MPITPAGEPPQAAVDHASQPLAGLRLLIVEDETLVAMLIEDILSEAGCVIVGPAASREQALELARSESYDGALLDVNLAGEPIYPVAEVVAERQIPFVFVTGYGGASLDPRFSGSAAVQKPFGADTLIAAVLDGIARRRPNA